MSEEDTDNNTSSVDQTATVIAATNDNVSSSLVSSLVGDTSSSSVVSGGSVNSTGSSLADLASAGYVSSDTASDLASAYSAAALSTLDQTYYAGSLNNAASLMGAETYALTLNNPPAQNKTTYSSAGQAVTWSTTTYPRVSNAATVGTVKFYSTNVGAVYTGVNTIGLGVGAGNAVYRNLGYVSVGAGIVSVGKGNQLWAGTDGATGSTNGNIALSFGGTTTTSPYRLMMADSSYLSAGGYLGGVADKSQAGSEVLLVKQQVLLVLGML